MWSRLERRLAQPSTERAVLGLVVLLALALRLLHVFAMREAPLFDAPQMDALYHVEWARALAAGEEFQDGPYFRAPLYPWLLGALFALFGDGLLLPRVVGAALGALSVALTYLIGRRSVGRAAGAVGAGLLAVHWVTIYYDGELLLEVLAVPLYLGALLATLRLVQAPRPSATGGLAAGALFGLGAICRPNVLLFLPLLALLLWRPLRLPHRPLLAFCVGVLLPVLPVTAINASEGDRVLVSYQAGVNFWIGNNPASDGSTAIAPGTRPDWWGGFEDTHAQAARAEGRPLAPSEVSRHYFRRARAWIAEEPGRWLSLLGHKARLFAMNWELGNNEEPRYLTERYSPVVASLPTSFALLLGLALAGLAGLRALGSGLAPDAEQDARPRWHAHLVLLSFAGVYVLSVVLFFVNARFRLPIVPLTALYAGSGALWIADRLAARRAGTALLAAVVALGTLAASRALVPPVVPRNAASNGRLIVGQAAMRDGEAVRARELLDEALELWPGNPVALEALASTGRLLFEQGDHEGAIQAFERVLSIAPDRFNEAFSLGQARLAAGHPGEALPAFESAVEAALERGAPAEDRYLYEALGRAITLREAAGDPAGARDLARRMVARFPGDAAAQGVLAQLEQRLGR